MVFQRHFCRAGNGSHPAARAICLMIWVAVCLSGSFAWAQTVSPFVESNAIYLAGEDVGQYATPYAVDLNRDGVLDILVGCDGTSSGNWLIRYFKNEGSQTDPDMVEQTDSDNPLGQITLSGQPKPAAADFDGDGFVDIIVGEDRNTTLHYYWNTGNADIPTFQEKTGDDNPFNSLTVNQFVPSPTVVDYDGDGDFDVFVCQAEINPEIILFKNIGNATSPSFTSLAEGENPFYGLTLHGEAGLSWGDMDMDGDFDAVLGGQNESLEGTLHYFENTQNATDMILTDWTGLDDDPFVGLHGNGAAKPTIGDFDDDGNPDVLVGYISDDVLLYQNGEGITLSHTSLPENKPRNTVVGTLGHTNATYTEFNLVHTDCGQDNSKFSVVDDQLLTKRMFSYEQQSLFHVEVNATDVGEYYFDSRCFVIRVTDERELFPSTLIPLGIP